MSGFLSADDARRLLVAKIAEVGTATKLAQIVGCQPSYVSMAASGTRPIGTKIAQYLGLVQEVQIRYRKDESAGLPV